VEIFFLGDEKLVQDLFGDIVTLPSGRRGRPAHRWSKSNADRVIMGLAMGYSDKEIALGLGVSLPTLRKYYFSELKRRDMQRMRFELWRAEVLAAKANEGDTGAMKELAKVIDRRDKHLLSEKMKASGDDQPVGKKEARRRAAAEAIDGDDLLKPGFGPH
jgi:hypothetical protein